MPVFSDRATAIAHAVAHKDEVHVMTCKTEQGLETWYHVAEPSAGFPGPAREVILCTLLHYFNTRELVAYERVTPT